MKEAILYLHDECNYSCNYCLLNQSWYTRQIPSLAWTDQGMAAITSFFAGWKIMLTGGEPTFHPRFLELAQELAKENLLPWTQITLCPWPSGRSLSSWSPPIEWIGSTAPCTQWI